RLVEEGEARVLPDDDVAGVGRDLAEDGADERRLAGAVRPDDADPIAGLPEEAEVAEERLSAERFAEAAELEDGLAEPPAGRPPGRQPQRQRSGAPVVAPGLGGHRLVEAIDARLLLGRSRRRPAPDPGELAPHEGGPLALARRLVLQALALLLEEARVAALV